MSVVTTIYHFIIIYTLIIQPAWTLITVSRTFDLKLDYSAATLKDQKVKL